MLSTLLAEFFWPARSAISNFSIATQSISSQGKSFTCLRENVLVAIPTEYVNIGERNKTFHTIVAIFGGPKILRLKTLVSFFRKCKKFIKLCDVVFCSVGSIGWSLGTLPFRESDSGSETKKALKIGWGTWKRIKIWTLELKRIEHVNNNQPHF